MARYECIESNQYDGLRAYQKGMIYELFGTVPAAYFTATTRDVRSNARKSLVDLDNTYYFGKNMVGWEDLRFPATGIDPPGLVSDPGRDNLDGTLLFDKASTEIIMGVAQMPHSWKEGTSVHPHIHWGPTSEGGGDVVWKFDYSVAAINGAFPDFSTESIAAAAGTTDAAHLVDEFTPVSMEGKTFSTMIKWRLSRVGGDSGDDYDADAKLYEVDFHYKIDSVGSGQEYAK